MERLAAALLIPGVLATRLHQLRDNQIGQLLLDEVWARMSPLHPESVICLQALDRLRGSPEGKSCQRPACPRCGREMYFHCGVEEPDYWQCDLRGCGGPRRAPIPAGGTSRMSSSLKMSGLGLELRVNGTVIDWVQLRACEQLPTELELVVRDPVLGEFAVDREAFTFEVRQKGEGAQWRQMSMDEALEEIAAADMILDIEDPPGAPTLEEHERLHHSDMRRGRRTPWERRVRTSSVPRRCCTAPESRTSFCQSSGIASPPMCSWCLACSRRRLPCAEGASSRLSPPTRSWCTSAADAPSGCSRRMARPRAITRKPQREKEQLSRWKEPSCASELQPPTRVDR